MADQYDSGLIEGAAGVVECGCPNLDILGVTEAFFRPNVVGSRGFGVDTTVHIVLAGLSLGLHGKSSPKTFNLMFIKGLSGWFLQVALLTMSLLSLGSAEAPLLDIVAYAGYTFAGLCFAVLGRIVWNYAHHFMMPSTTPAGITISCSSLAQFPLFIWLGNISVNWLL